MDSASISDGLRYLEAGASAHYQGEGFSAVWFKGRYYDSFDISFAKWPDGTGCGGTHCAATYIDLGAKSWWANVKLKSGLTGWVEMDLGHTPVSLV